MKTGSPARVPITAPTPLALGLRLLDHQLVGSRHGELLGNVDDVAMEERDGHLVAVGLLRGPGAWAHRQPGALGRWGVAVWRRLDPRADPVPLMLPLDHVVSIGSAVVVDPWASDLLARSDALELWMRRHVVSKIPGARGGDHPVGGEPPTRGTGDEEPSMPAGGHRLSELLGAPVELADGSRAGRVVEVRAEQRSPTTSRVGPLVVTTLVHGPRRLAGELGYREDAAMGPRLMGAAVRRWHRYDVETAWRDVRAVDWPGSRVLLRRPAPASGQSR